MSRIDDLQKGITSLEFRISALSLRLANAKSSTASTEDPISVAKQIALYGRVLDILRDELDTAKYAEQQANEVNIKPQPTTFWK